MGIEHLQNLERIRQLSHEPPSRTEFEGLVLSGQRRLLDAQNLTLSAESRFDLAYNAAHSLSLAALRWHGYRSGNRYLVFQCLAHTVELPNEKWRILDRAHKKRNLSEYEGVTDFESTLTESVIRVALEIERRVIAFGEPLGGWPDLSIA